MKKFFNAVLWLIGVNFVFFLASNVLIFSNPDYIKYIAFSPDNFVHGQYLWTLITSMFMHAGVAHLFVNMFSLLFLGQFLERLIGSKRLLGIYFISGLIASLFYVLFAYLFNQNPAIYAVGASGAIFGLAGMLAILTPKLPVYIFFIPIAMPMWFGVILILMVMWIFSALANVPIGNAAHLGGLVTGIIYALYLKNKHKRKARIIADFYK